MVREGFTGIIRMQPGVKRNGISDFFTYTPLNDWVLISKNQLPFEPFRGKLGIEFAKCFS